MSLYYNHYLSGNYIIVLKNTGDCITSLKSRIFVKTTNFCHYLMFYKLRIIYLRGFFGKYELRSKPHKPNPLNLNTHEEIEVSKLLFYLGERWFEERSFHYIPDVNKSSIN
jgi:hypothetical protein